MKNKNVERILQEELINEVEKIYIQNDKVSIDNKIKMIDEKYKETFSEICDLLEYKLGRNSVSALYNIEDMFNDSKIELITFVEKENDEKYYNTGIKSILRSKIDALFSQLENINEDKELDETNYSIKNALEIVNSELNESRDYASNQMKRNVEYKVEDSVLTELKYNITNILNRRELNDDEIEYEIGKILDRKLYQPILEEFNLLEKINERNINSEKDNFFENVVNKCLDEFSKEFENNEQEHEDLEDSDEFINDLKDDVKSEEEMLKGEVKEKDEEERRIDEINKMLENLRF